MQYTLWTVFWLFVLTLDYGLSFGPCKGQILVTNIFDKKRLQYVLQVHIICYNNR
jgi:hypothetical protein